MKPIRILSCLVLMAGTLLCVPVFADDTAAPNQTTTVDPEPRQVAEGPGGREGFKQHGSFTDDQLSKIAAIRQSLREKTAPQREQLMSLKSQLKNIMMADTIDRSQATSIQSKINQLKGDMATARLNAQIDILGVLNPEQRQHMRHHMLMRDAFGGHHRGGGCSEQGGRGSCGEHHHGGGGWHHHEGGGEHHHDGGGGGATKGTSTSS